MRTKFIAMAALAAACSTGYAEPTKKDTTPAGAAPKTRATRVETAVVKPTRPKLQLVLPAEVQGSRDAKLASRIGGYVEKLFVKRGDRVRSGQTIAWIDRAQQQVMVEQAKINAEHAEAELARANKAGASLTKARRDAAEYQAKLAAVNLQLAEIGLSNATVRAPFDGVIAAVRVEVGEVLPPGGQIARLVQVDPISVSISASDKDVGALAEGLKVSVAAEALGQVIEGKIHHVSPAADLDTRAFEVEVWVPNADRALLPGMIASVRVERELEEDAVAIPQYVLVTRRTGNGVFVVDGGVARWRPVVLGRLVNGQVIVKSGVATGEQLVVTGHRELADGDPIIVVRHGECCTEGRVSFGAADAP